MATSVAPRRRTLLATTLAVCLLSIAPAVAQEPSPGAGDSFVIGVEDRLRIDVWEQPSLSMSLTVRPDGMITVPLVGDVRAAGRTPSQLSSELSVALARYIKEPIVTVIVEQINHFKVFVLGEVASQGVQQLSGPTRLLQVIAMAGGLTAYADKSNIMVVRYENGEEVRTRVDYRKVLSGQNPEMNLELKPGDMIIVK